MKWLVSAILVTTTAAFNLKGAGSTLICDAMRDIYERDIEGDYECSGSGRGKEKLFAGEVQYAMSDYPLTTEEENTYGITSLPVVAVEVAIIYNTPHKGRLILEDVSIGKIFTGEIQHWNELSDLNSDFNFPREKIQVAVRSGLSGTSYILTDGLRKFGYVKERNPLFCEAVDDVCEKSDFFMASKTSDVINFVRNTPHSIGYVGVKTAIEYNIPFAGIRVGGHIKLPTIESGRAALTGLLTDYNIPYHIPAQGYPIEGLAYVLYKKAELITSENCDGTLSLFNFLLEVYTGGWSSELFQNHWMVSMTSSVINLIKQNLINSKQLLLPVCNVKLNNVVSVGGPLAKSAYYQNFILTHGRQADSKDVDIRVQNTTENPAIDLTLVPLLDLLNTERDVSTQWSEHIFGVRELVFLVRDRHNLQIPARIPWEGMRGILDGTITEWDHPLIATNKNAFTELPSSGPIRFIISHDYGGIINIIAKVFNIHVGAIRYESVSTADLNALYTEQSFLTCVDFDSKPDAGIIHTILDGSDRAPFQFRNSDFDVQKNGGVVLNHHEPVYPFTYLMIHRVPTQIHIDPAAYRKRTGSTRDPCTEHVVEGIINYITFCSSFGGLSGAPEATKRNLRLISCNGVVLFPDENESDFLVLTISLSSGAFLLFVIAIVVYFRWRLGASRGKIKNLIDNNKLAVEIAEAIADMRLEDMMWITELDSPDKLQECFGKIISNIREYRRYLPDTILYQKDSEEIDRFIGAPKNDSNVAIVFTDVQSSTALWDAVPDTMAVALRTHHKTMREVIKECEGYEVKTIGDAFMVAFQCPKMAVRFGLLVQERLLHAEWPAQLQSVGMCETVSDRGVKIWGGLRVRIGIHCGPVTSEEDPLTGRKDYYGPTVNKAARVEAKSIGGLLTVSEEVFLAVFSGTDGLSAASAPLGGFELKGIKGTHQLHCMAPFIIASRLSLLTRRNDEEDAVVNIKSTAAPETNAKLAAFFKSVTGCVLFIELKHNCETMSTGQLNYVCTSFVDLIDVSADRYNGTVHTHLGNCLLMGWNTGGKLCSDFIQSASRCSAHICSKGSAMGKLRIGMSAGTFATGNAGARKRTATLTSAHVNIAQLLCSAAADLGTSILCADLPGCPAFASTSGVCDIIRPLMKWTIDNTKLAIIYELNHSLVDDWGYSSDTYWGMTSITSAIFEQMWNCRNMSELITHVGTNSDDTVLDKIAHIPPGEYFNMYRAVQAAIPEEVSS